MTVLPQKYVCHKCGSDDLDVEATVEWSVENQCWGINDITWSECRECNQTGDYEVWGHFVEDKSLKTLAIKAIQEAS